MTPKYTIRLLLLFALLLATACEKLDEGAIFTEVSVRFVMPDSRPIERIEVLKDRSWCYNINTYEYTAFPDIVQNRASIRLRKGVYTFMVEARAFYATGDEKLLRCADHNQVAQATTWTQAQEPVVLLFKTVE